MMDEKQITEVFNAYLRGEWPDGIAIATAPRLSNWRVVIGTFNGAYIMHLAGNCTGHPDLPDGAVTTSQVIWIDRERCLAHTMSRLYVLNNEASEPVAW